jgi:hypothetical protein
MTSCKLNLHKELLCENNCWDYKFAKCLGVEYACSWRILLCNALLLFKNLYVRIQGAKHLDIWKYQGVKVSYMYRRQKKDMKKKTWRATETSRECEWERIVYNTVPLNLSLFFCDSSKVGVHTCKQALESCGELLTPQKSKLWGDNKV